MIPFFPHQISSRAIVTYAVALAIVSVLFMGYAMPVEQFVLGIVFVAGFFSLTHVWSRAAGSVSERQYTASIFWFAVVLRLFWVVASYFYYIDVTGSPFEVGAADSWGYHNEAEWLASEPWSTTWHYYGSYRVGISDVGYSFYLTLLYKIFGPIIILPRIIKVFLSAWMCILVYRLSARMFGEPVGRMAGIMCALMPNLIIYCGYHLKETEMLFLEVAFLERTDYLIRTRNSTTLNLLLPSLLAGSLFFFRTVLGAAAIFSFATAIMLSSSPAMKRNNRRIVIVGWGILCLIVAGGGTVMTELEGYWEQKDTNVVNKRIEQTRGGNRWAKYATGTVMAPMVMALPFSTMVETEADQVAQQTKHGGNYVRNFMAFFALLAIYEALRQKKWRDFALVGSFVVAYLGVVSMSGFSNSERFLLPGLPCLIMMWAYGVSELREQTYRLFTPWCALVVLLEFGWAFFKLGSRGMF